MHSRGEQVEPEPSSLSEIGPGTSAVDQMKEKTIAMIGTGIMGRGMAVNLAKAGHRLRLYARSPEKLADLKEAGMETFGCPGDAVEGADVTILCLTEDDVVRSTVRFGGILEKARGCVIDTGTTSPDLTLEMHRWFAGKGVSFFDAPVTGGKIGAQNGTLVFMVGGETSMEEGRFLFESCGKKAIHCGGVGDGQRIKIILNMVQAAQVQALAEGVVFTRKLGLDPAVYADAVSSSGIQSALADAKLAQMAKSDFAPRFTVRNMNKDLNHAARMAAKTSTVLPLAQTTKTIFDAAMNGGESEMDYGALIKTNERLNGM